MLIMPTTTPLALTDLNQGNQAQQQQNHNVEHSRRATDTVQLSAQARALADSGQKNEPAISAAPAPTQAVSDRELVEKVADNETIEQQRPSNPITHMPETTKIDILA